jgi:hypothetical protein
LLACDRGDGLRAPVRGKHGHDDRDDERGNHEDDARSNADPDAHTTRTCPRPRREAVQFVRARFSLHP